MMQTIALTRPLVLASASPRRAELLRQVGIPFVVQPAHAREAPPRPGEDVRRWARDAAVAKVQAAAPHVDPPALILGADTAVIRRVDPATPDAPRWEGRPVDVMGKPSDAAMAFRMLRALAGCTHTVISAVALLARPEGEIVAETVAADVTFRHLDDDEISWYLSTGEPYDKAGAYGIQGYGAVLVDQIHGDYYTVVGLPVARVWTWLQSWRAR